LGNPDVLCFGKTLKNFGKMLSCPSVVQEKGLDVSESGMVGCGQTKEVWVKCF
jgi:hypothetical protein